jgi:hypothetical protein
MDMIDWIIASVLVAVCVICGQIHSAMRTQGCWSKPICVPLHKGTVYSAAGVLKGIVVGFFTSIYPRL